MNENRSNKGWWIVVIIVVVALLWWGNSKSSSNSNMNSNASTDSGSIKIGFIGPLTGDASAYGEPAKNAVEMAVKEVNGAGGINGRQIQMIYEDGKCNGKDSASAAQKLVGVDQVKYIIGGMCSGEVFSQIPVTSPAKVFAISPIASAAKLSGISPYFVRNNPSDAITGVVLADYLSKKYKTVAIISEQTEYAQGIKEVFTAQAEKDGLKVVFSENFSTGITDFRSVLTKVKQQNPDIVFVNPQTGQNFVRIAEQAKQVGIKSQLASALLGSDPIVLAGGAATEGLVSANLGGLSDTKGKEFTEKYKKTYNAEPNFPLYDGAAYDDVYLLTQAISSVGDDSTKVAEYVRSITSYSGTLGSYHFDQNGDIVGAGIIMQKISKGKVVGL